MSTCTTKESLARILQISETEGNPTLSSALMEAAKNSDMPLKSLYTKTPISTPQFKMILTHNEVHFFYRNGVRIGYISDDADA